MTLREQLNIAMQALKDIENPIAGMQRKLKPDERLGSSAYSISRDPEYLKNIARQAIATLVAR